MGNVKRVVIDYRDETSIKAIMALSGILGFTVSEPAKREERPAGATEGDEDPDVRFKGLMDIFTGSGIDPTELRRRAWQRER